MEQTIRHETMVSWSWHILTFRAASGVRAKEIAMDTTRRPTTAVVAPMTFHRFPWPRGEIMETHPGLPRSALGHDIAVADLGGWSPCWLALRSSNLRCFTWDVLILLEELYFEQLEILCFNVPTDWFELCFWMVSINTLNEGQKGCACSRFGGHPNFQ